MKLFSGYSDFGSIIENGLDFVDKSLFIEDIIQDTNQVLLITRPRRFGKTFNLSMLRHFFASTVAGHQTQGLFQGLKIASKLNIMAHQGQYPVINLSFKDIKNDNFEEAYRDLCMIISDIYAQHEFLLTSNHLQDRYKREIELLLERKADETALRFSLKNLSYYLYQHSGKKSIILIDEYDTPIQTGYLSNYYEDIAKFMRHFLSSALKDNDYLYKAVLTGILRVSKESLFSGLNNLKVYSVLQKGYRNYFGFIEEEVRVLFACAGLNGQLEEAKRWYNGYQIGGEQIYNPWSIVNCIQEKGMCQPYWVNTSDNDLVNQLVIKSSVGFKHDLERLLRGESIDISLNEYFTFPDLKKNESAIWSLLLMAGYLKVIEQHITEDGLTSCRLEIPNVEIKSLYRRFIKEWLSPTEEVEGYNHFLNHLLNGEVDKFTTGLERVLLQVVSIHDVAQEPEAFYQGLMLGLTAGLNPEDYEIKSNRESGVGRYDIVIIPKNKNALGIILELKSVKKPAKGDVSIKILEQESLSALSQIEQKAYVTELIQRGLSRILKLGLAFSGKYVHVASNLSR